MLRRFWNDDAGFVISAELILIATILVIGLIVGLTVLRNQIVQELVDVGQAIGAVSQGYCYSGTFKPFVAWTDGSSYVDLVDFCQAPQQPAQEPGGISVRMFPIGAPGFPTGGEAGGGGAHP
jgi:Flp pilus assembly pilin Flp